MTDNFAPETGLTGLPTQISQPQQLHNSLLSAADLLARSLSTVVLNSSSPTMRDEVMQLLGAESCDALDDAIYSCVYAQLDLPRGSATLVPGGATQRPSAAVIPPGCDMDLRLQRLAAEAMAIPPGQVAIASRLMATPPGARALEEIVQRNVEAGEGEAEGGGLMEEEDDDDDDVLFDHLVE